MSSPVDRLMDSVKWTEMDAPDQLHTDDIFATHEGELSIAGKTLKVYQLNNGQRVIDQESLEGFFGFGRDK